MTSKRIRIEKIILDLHEDESILEKKICNILSISQKEILGFSLIKKAIDARDKNRIIFVYSVNVEVIDINKVFS
jgi:uncharacterized FAD-dependent dehydrogenase